ncbi:kinase-like protein [Sistotremastrum suecicum HHB10207 ss-3]|uniref:Kinase-like protein n=1 Tax=Sistotremastrum suecicum HHB10207 ss-3 TaxID=1314776 RepID=A0A166CWT4_9AGAM|nr:kinase-like protein [Sistotremastrum suecicum HHB10207 ss-3]
MEWLHHANGGFSNIYKTPPLFPEDKSWVLKVPRCTEKSRDTKATQKVSKLRFPVELKPLNWAQAIEEFILWRQLKHENILPFLGVCEYNGIWGGVSPWMTQGDLCKYLVDNPEVDRLPLIIGIISAVKYLHVSVPHCIHRDIKPNNILIGDDGTPLLGDFGLSSVQYDYTKNITTATAGGTIMYMPPEWLLDTNTSATMSSDVYSLSVTIAEVLTGKAPYHQQQAHPIILAHRNISPFEKPFPLLKLTARDDDVKEFWRLMERCWNREAQQRPHVSDLYSWFTKLQETTSSGERVQGKVGYEAVTMVLFSDVSQKRCIFIPSKNCGYLIGRNGSRVKHLQAKYKVQIRLGSNSDGDTREAEITGSPRNVALSIDQIEQVSDQFSPKSWHLY